MKEKLTYRNYVAIAIFLITTLMIICYTIINRNIDSDGKMNQTNIEKYRNYGRC